MRVLPGSPLAQFLETLSPDDPRHYGMPLGGPPNRGEPIRPGGRPALPNIINQPIESAGGFGLTTPFPRPNPGTINSFNSTPFPAPLTQQLGTVNNNVKGGGDFTLAGMSQQPVQLAGMAQQPVQQPIQQPMQNPLGGGLSALNQQPFGMNQQPLQMNGGLKAILDNYMNNYINNYFMNALK
jgi:hypothetical protein